MPKRSRLEAKKLRTNIVEPTIQKPDHLITGPKKCPKNDHLNTGLSGLRMFTVYTLILSKKTDEKSGSLGHRLKFYLSAILFYNVTN
jgi:hypothetical protein